MQAIATNRIKIGQLVWKLWHFKDEWSKLESFVDVATLTISV